MDCYRTFHRSADTVIRQKLLKQLRVTREETSGVILRHATSCHNNLSLNRYFPLSISVFAIPTITRINSEGGKNIDLTY